MIFDGRPIDEIGDAEFDRLVREHVSERQHLEFKGTYEIREPKDRLELLRDVTSLANGGGGYLIIGVQDDGTGRPLDYRPQSKESLERMKTSIQQLCLDHIAERIPRLEARVREPNNNPILVVFVPDSVQVPHMVKFERRTDFYTRYEQGKREMSIAEIRREFQEDRMQLGLESLSHKMDEVLKRLSTERAAKLTGVTSEEPAKAELTPFFPSSFSNGYKLIQATYDRMIRKVDGEPHFWIGVTPVLLDRDALDADSKGIRDLITTAPGSRSSGWNMESSRTIENVADGIERGSEDDEYLLLYRNAHMEFGIHLNQHFRWKQTPEDFAKRPELYPYPVVEYPVTFLRLYQAILQSAKLQGELIVQLVYLNLKGYRLRPYGPKQSGYMFADEVRPFPYQHLELPLLKVDQSFDPDRTAFSLLGQVYNAFGLSTDTIPFWHEDCFVFPS